MLDGAVQQVRCTAPPAGYELSKIEDQEFGGILAVLVTNL